MSWPFLLALTPKRLFTTAAVPGFFILSGIKLFLHLPESLPRYYKKRACTLLFPYLIAVTVYYFWYIVRYNWSFSLLHLLRYWLIGDIAAQFYFLVALVQFILLTPLWKRVVERYDAILVLPFSIIITALSRNYSSSLLALLPGLDPNNGNILFTNYLFFYLCGCYIGKYYSEFLELIQKNKVLILSVFAVFALADVILSALDFSGRVEITALSTVHLTYTTVAVLTCFLFFPQMPAMPKPLERLNQSTYLIYLYHMLAILLFNSLSLPVFDSGLRLLLKLLFVYSLVIAGCMLWRYGAICIKNTIKR